MPDSRGSRFLLEVLFLVGLAVALTLAQLTPVEIAGVMALGWVIVALLEWAAWRDEPHYGAGLPPRYYVPQVSLPPAQPLEQLPTGYPESQRDEAPTWIASAELRAEMLGVWPVATPVAEAAAEPEVDELDAQPELRLEANDPWVVAELPPPVAEPADTVEEALLDVVLFRSQQGLARYSLEPLGDPPPKKRFGRGPKDEAPAVDVPARPNGVRALPGATRQD